MPLPKRQVGLVSGAVLIGPLVILTGLSLRAGADGPDAAPRTLTVEARDLGTDSAVAGVKLTLRLPENVKLEATTAADGVARFEYTLPAAPNGRYFQLGARRDGLVPLYENWYGKTAAPAPPERLRLLMEQATTISGRVFDEKGQPLADAVVVVNVTKKYPGSEQRVGAGGKSARTGPDGRWSFQDAPEQPDSVELAAYHYLCLSDRSAYNLEAFQPLAALRDGSAELRLTRGTRVEGTVLAPDGQPVAGAEVRYGLGKGFGNSIPPVTSDAQGRFTLGIKPGTFATLVASATGFGPTLQKLKVGSAGPQRAYLTLTETHSVRGRVVDPSGSPLPHATVRLFWSGADVSGGSYFGSAIADQFTTDSDGRFVWNEAPASGVHAAVYAAGFAGFESRAVASDTDQDIVLSRPTTVKGTVVDRETGQPVEQFSLTAAARWKPADPLIWQRGWSFDEEARRAPGSFETTLESPAHHYLIRVQADGYFAEDSALFTPDGDTHLLSYRLTRGKPVRGTVLNPDGTTARGGFVHLVPPHRDDWIDYLAYPDDLRDPARPRAVHAAIGPDGRLALPPQREDFAILVLTDGGSLLPPRDALLGDDVLRLQPWAHIDGTMTLDSKPAAGIGLQSYEPDESAPVVGKPRLVPRYRVQTDSEGRFELTRVLPGRLTLAQWVPNGVDRRIWGVVRATVDVAGGGSYHLKIGTSGRLVNARLALPSSDVWMIRKAEIVRQDKLASRPAPIGVELLEEGRIRALDLAPGDYALRVSLHEPPPAHSCGWGRLVGEYRHEFTVPPDPTASAPPLELGTLEPVAVGGRPLKLGDRAPDIALRTLEGKELALADLRGKYVLLDFWASWCAPCLAEMPNLQRVHDAFASDPRFALVGVSLDERPSAAAATVKSLKLAWTQACAEPDSPAVAVYGATAIPMTLLIGPDGTILATDLRGEKTMSAVAAVLKP